MEEERGEGKTRVKGERRKEKKGKGGKKEGNSEHG